MMKLKICLQPNLIEVLVQLIGVNRVNLDEIFRGNYSNAFIREANDLQILEAVAVAMKNLNPSTLMYQ